MYAAPQKYRSTFLIIYSQLFSIMINYHNYVAIGSCCFFLCVQYKKKIWEMLKNKYNLTTFSMTFEARNILIKK